MEEKTAARNKGGRPPKPMGEKRVSIHFYAPKSHEEWLNRRKVETGKSWGEILDALVEKEAGDVE